MSSIQDPAAWFFERGASEAAEGCLASVAAKLVKTGTKILSLYIRVEINRAGIFGPFLLDFGAISKIISEIYIRVEINRAGVFGPFLLDFGAISKIISEIYIRVEINRAGAFGPFFCWILGRFLKSSIKYTSAWKQIRPAYLGLFRLYFGVTRNILPLAASLSSALELQNIEFVK